MTRSWLAGVALATCFLIPPAQAADPAGKPRVYTNQDYVEDAARPARLPIDDLKPMLSFVLGSLPPRVKVYPTENYFYFNFMHGGIRYAGNIRLDVHDRDDGKVNFAYFEDLTEWTVEKPVKHRILGKEDGVLVEKLEKLVYRVSYEGTSVVFELNDLSGVRPPPGLLHADERYIGPVFDESGMRFLLVYNGKLKIFHYILDEQIPIADRLVKSEKIDRIFLGQRTGFAYYLDHRIDRKLLIGVFEGNARVNNYFDGPFDQLPDNFIEGEALRSAILEVEPSLAGRIDRLGIAPGGADRFMIAPYRHYRTEDDLLIFHECATGKDIPPEMYYGCFVFLEDDQDAPPAPVVNGKTQKPREKKSPRPAKKAPTQAVR